MAKQNLQGSLIMIRLFCLFFIFTIVFNQQVFASPSTDSMDISRLFPGLEFDYCSVDCKWIKSLWSLSFGADLSVGKLSKAFPLAVVFPMIVFTGIGLLLFFAVVGSAVFVNQVRAGRFGFGRSMLSRIDGPQAIHNNKPVFTLMQDDWVQPLMDFFRGNEMVESVSCELLRHGGVKVDKKQNNLPREIRQKKHFCFDVLSKEIHRTLNLLKKLRTNN